MNRTLRIVIAYIVAPAVASSIVAVVGASLRPPGEGPSWIAAFGQYFFVASLTSYAISYTAGTLTFVVLRKMRREFFWIYGAIGGVLGLLYGIVVGVISGISLERIAAATFFALLGFSVAATFALIRRNEERAYQLPEPTTMAVTPRATEGIAK